MCNLTVTRMSCQEGFRAGGKSRFLAQRARFGMTTFMVRVRLSHQVEESLVDAVIGGELWVEGGGHGSSLPDGYGGFIGAFGGKDFDAFADVNNLGSTDEGHFERGFT